ncbi:MAG TPA: hypothetical protein VG248_19150 [Caulobacteraceae bacterium]|nr:hypothetical protein [Caulobacteraceae bacterium]
MTRVATACRGIVSLSLATLASCMSTPQPAQFSSRMDAAVRRFTDQPVNLAVVRLGSEDRRTSTQGVTTYVWRGERMFDTQRFNTMTSNGHVGMVSMLGNANYARYAPAADICELQFDVGSNSHVRIGRWSGTATGCLGYAEALER